MLLGVGKYSSALGTNVLKHTLDHCQLLGKSRGRGTQVWHLSLKRHWVPTESGLQGRSVVQQKQAIERHILSFGRKRMLGQSPPRYLSWGTGTQAASEKALFTVREWPGPNKVQHRIGWMEGLSSYVPSTTWFPTGPRPQLSSFSMPEPGVWGTLPSTEVNPR